MTDKYKTCQTNSKLTFFDLLARKNPEVLTVTYNAISVLKSWMSSQRGTQDVNVNVVNQVFGGTGILVGSC